MGTSRLRTPSGARLTSRDPEGVPVTARGDAEKIYQVGKNFKGSSKIFFVRHCDG